MKTVRYSILFAILLLIVNNSSHAQCSCTAGELTGISVNKDGECSSDLYTGYQNHVTIQLQRAQIKTGTIQWSFLPDNGTGSWTSLPGGWTGIENLDHPSFSTSENGTYRCIFIETATNCRDTGIAYISVAPQPNIYVTNDSTTCEGIWFSVHDNNNPTGSGNSNCWQFDGTNCQSDDPSFLFTTAGCTMGNNHVNIIVSNWAGCFDEVHLSAICNSDLLDIFTELSGSETLCRGDKSSVLSVKRHSAISFPVTWQFQWQRNGMAISGATSPDFTPTKSGAYTCKVVSTSGCQKTTNPISITFFPPVIAQISTPVPEICTGDSILLQVYTGNAVQYEWYRNGISLGVSGTDYYARKPGNYKVLATSIEGCTKYSNVIHPYVFTATIQASGNQNLCNGDSVMLTASYNSNAASFQWLKYNSPISGASASSFYAKKTGRYRVVAISDNNCKDTSNSIYISNSCREKISESEFSFSIQPNPASSFIEIISPSVVENTDGILMITNSLGQELFNTKINLSPSGIERISIPQRIECGNYFVILMVNDHRYFRKLFICQ